MPSSSRPVVVVTGASAGVGRAISEAFAASGWDIGLIARGRAGLASTAQAVEALGVRALALPADVADPDAIFAAADEVERELGPVEAWVNNAMVTIYAPVVDISPAEFRRVTEVTYLGQVHGTLAALRCMRPRNRGRILSIGSALAYRSIPLQAPYCAAKAATRAFIDSLRSELIHDGSAISLTCLHLPAVNTPQFDWARSRLPRRLQPVPPIVQPETIAAAVLAAARTGPRELWIGSSTVKAIAGQMLAPGYADRVLARSGEAGEMTDEPARPRPDNLFHPVDCDPGAHGRFDDRATTSAYPFDPRWLRAGAGAAALCLGAAFAGLLVSRTSARSRRQLSGAS